MLRVAEDAQGAEEWGVVVFFSEISTSNVVDLFGLHS
jgi:hypothetical protein